MDEPIPVQVARSASLGAGVASFFIFGPFAPGVRIETVSVFGVNSDGTSTGTGSFCAFDARGFGSLPAASDTAFVTSRSPYGLGEFLNPTAKPLIPWHLALLNATGPDVAGWLDAVIPSGWVASESERWFAVRLLSNVDGLATVALTFGK